MREPVNFTNLFILVSEGTIIPTFLIDSLSYSNHLWWTGWRKHRRDDQKENFLLTAEKVNKGLRAKLQLQKKHSKSSWAGFFVLHPGKQRCWAEITQLFLHELNHKYFWFVLISILYTSEWKNWQSHFFFGMTCKIADKVSNLIRTRNPVNMKHGRPPGLYCWSCLFEDWNKFTTNWFKDTVWPERL